MLPQASYMNSEQFRDDVELDRRARVLPSGRYLVKRLLRHAQDRESEHKRSQN